MFRIVKFLDVRQIAVSNASNNGPLRPIIDVRGRDEIASTGLIPTSVNVPLDVLAEALGDATTAQQFQERFGAMKPSKDDEVVFTCLKGMRAKKACQCALDLGYQRVAQYEGSWDEWSRLSKDQ